MALGGGAARGWAHIGVILALEEHGIRPDIVCGTSIGALVGAAYSVGEIERFKDWAVGLTIKNVVGFMDIALNGGVLKGERLMAFFRQNFIDCSIEDMELPFGAVATALHTGAEVWLRSGSALDAIRASIALPGLFAPVWHSGRLLVDGGLVNPVPVSLAHAMGADIVIAVDLSSDTLGRHLIQPPVKTSKSGSPASEWVRKIKSEVGATLFSDASDEHRLPSVLDVVASSLNIMQVRITRSRMAGEPPDIIITPKLAHLGLLDFHRAQQAIEAGRESVELCLPAIKGLRLRGS
ncbi:patatin-like phospholipase RssA [Eoetvoesiella caeni]|uniref:patatin-like phospholipase RssA n=1 Tax=Eoetvoesiella caeni TaxID=645616 RepID=UPI001F56E36A|nr:patatin-like phospholipase RssA [Eoetvoesiella caeni]MCI2807693.1 patatin-like phospholipase RssA [Eoetvoesiella caeni]